ncbi:hypothetical protein N9N28_10955 [Rubripirellula amarantea]|uniref:Uncharacterized protein n=1 Tax=Rubripirellula amarantea TaxID=2527999 RepID=A0A5C5WGQ3_9BACT|nr:hypothetical protein [Rubripirellula amarantea]MDA8745141.1 hypothetical protein [Rubripirellula amarantea]TWT49289.1 hypothetical protein Pla22_44830 [Rubripirellula amarantea]
MCQTIHVTDIRDEAFEILEEQQNESGHLVSIADAELCERLWELDTADLDDFTDSGEACLVLPWEAS